MENTRLPFLKEKVKKLPLDPGVYIMRNQEGTIIYIGKAKALRNRVTSYFRSIEKHLPKVYRMVMNVYDFDYIVTKNEFEALVLECALIKQYTPKYNILLKDDKGYTYIKVSEGEYPKITCEKRKDDSGTFFGPYTSSFVARETVDQVNSVFMLPTCNRRFPAEIGKGRPCLNFHIKQCIAPCSGKIGAVEYNEIVKEATSYIRVGNMQTIQTLTEQMNRCAEDLEFEKAAKLRDRITALNRVIEQQQVVFENDLEEDAIGFSQNKERLCAVVLKFRNGRLHDKTHFMLGEADDLGHARLEFLMQYYSAGLDIPKQIVIDGEVEDLELAEKFISEKAGSRVKLLVPQRGEQLKIVNMASANAAQQLAEQSNLSAKEITVLEEVGKLLGMKNTPSYIEAYDISNFGETTMVAGMIVFEDGHPLKSAYKRFSIKRVAGQDDYSCMREVLERRFNRYREENAKGNAQSGFGRLPDLILLDGGQGHVNVIRTLLAEMQLEVPVFGMVKDGKHKTRAIASDGGEIVISSHRLAFRLIYAIQEEVHRYAVSYSRQKHGNTLLQSSLMEIKGIGRAKQKRLMQQFKTLTAIRKASIEELAAVSGISESLAQEIHRHFHPINTI